MKTFYINEARDVLLAVDSDTRAVETFFPMEQVIRESMTPTVPTEKKAPEAIAKVPDGVKKPGKKGSSKILIVNKDNWQDFEVRTAAEVRELSEEDQAEYKRQYAKFGYYRKNYGVAAENDSNNSDYTPKVASSMPVFASKAIGTLERDDRNQVFDNYKHLPRVLLQKYGVTAVEVVLAEKNRGIGYTADEIFETRDKRISKLSMSEIEDIFDGLVEAGM